MRQTNLSSAQRFLPSVLLAGLLVGAGCGGGGGGTASGPSSEPTPTPVVVPVDPPTNLPHGHSTAGVVLENDDATAAGFVIGNIEDAALADDGSMALIATESGGDQRAILRINPGSRAETILDSTNAPDDIDLTTLTRLRMAPTGELAFQSGEGLDSDQLHLAVGNDVQTIAGHAGAIAPAFRVLGNFRITNNGVVAFVGGGGECTTEANGDSVRDLCTLALFVADESGVERLQRDDFELDRRQANDAQIAVNQSGGLFFSIPGRRESPVLVDVVDGEVDVLLRNNGELPDEGVVKRIDIVDLDESGRVLVELGLPPASPDEPVRDRVGVLVGQHFTQFAAEGTVEGDKTLFSLRGIGLGGGRALYEATLVDAAQSESTCLRLGNEQSTIEIACVGSAFPEESKEIFDIAGARINDTGDVLFITSLGTRSEGTVRLEEIRASVRRVDGKLVTIASSEDAEALGTITALTSTGFNNAGQALLIAERSRSSDRALLLGDSR